MYFNNEINIILYILMEYSFDSEYPKRNHGRPKLEEVVTLDFKILQFVEDSSSLEQMNITK